MRRFVPTAAGLVVGALALSAHAQVHFNEIFVNPPGADQGQEFLEFLGTPGASLSGLHLVIIEGDGGAAGTLDVVQSLDGLTLGANGMLLWRDSADVIDTSDAPGIQGPDPLTSIFVQDFNPDIENGSNTFLIVSGFTGMQGADLDAANDGVLDTVPWASVLSAVGFAENDGAANVTYAAQFGGTAFAANPDFNPDDLVLGTDGVWYSSDALGTNPAGPYTMDPDRNFPVISGGPFVLTPGVANTVPGPASAALLGIGTLLVGRRRR